ncbi:MAG: ABC transporter permease [Acidobacteria bacterium]|nr:ABC transporter permease [Acidobacteriota bacterium]
MRTIRQDIRYALRLAAKNPGFSLVAILTLALGIGATTAIFSVVNEVLLRTLPYRESDRLVMVWEHNRPRAREMNAVSPANFLDWSETNQVFSDMAAFGDRRYNLTGVDDPEEIAAQGASAGFFNLLGATAAIGRVFTDEDGQPDAPPVVVLGYGLWQRRFGGEAGIVGRQIQLNGDSYTVIGIMPPDFRFFIKEASFGGKAAEMWTPMRFTPAARMRRGRSVAAIARLRDGVSFEQARAEMDAIGARLEREYPDFNTGWGINVVPLHRQITGDIRPALWILFGAVGCVLLIACVNVANLLLARAAVREREMAVRAALGAGRLRIIRQLLTESVVLATAGGLLGLLVARWGMDFLLGLLPEGLLAIDRVGLDLRVLGFTFAAALLTGVLFGLAPAIISSRTELHESLKEGGRASSGGSRRLRGGLVIAEVAMALVLLAGAGLLIRSFDRLQSVDPGFNARNLLTVRMALPGSKYGEDSKVIGFYRQLIERVRALPGVRAASANAFAPFTGPGSATRFEIVGRPKPAAGQEPTTDVRIIDPDYFHTMGVPLRAGRTFNEAEAVEMRHVVIINETLARQHFPDRNPLGEKLIINMKSENAPCEIVGVVGDVKHTALDAPVREMVYWPHPELAYPLMTLMVRTDSDPLALAGAIRREVASLDPDQPISHVRTMEQLLAASTARARFGATLLGIFAGVAMLLAAIGIYGVMSYTVAQRRREIGIRMALGANGRDVVRLVLRNGMMLAATGIGIGLPAAFALARLMSGMLFGIEATDPLTFITVALLLAGAAFAACYLPARRATRVDPMIALRYE